MQISFKYYQELVAKNIIQSDEEKIISSEKQITTSMYITILRRPNLMLVFRYYLVSVLISFYNYHLAPLKVSQRDTILKN